MALIYCGVGWGKTAVGEYDNGIIYCGTGWGKTVIGEYDNNTIYRGTGWGKAAIGEYDNDTIYSGTGWSKTTIGEYSNGTAYDGTGWGKTAVGGYDSSPAGAAALLLFPELQRSTERTSNSGTQPPSSSPGCIGDGCLAYLLKILGAIVGIAVFLYLVYVMYFCVEWTWANYAMFFTSIGAFFFSNRVLYHRYYEQTIPEFLDDLFYGGLGLPLIIGAVVAFVIYIIEQIILGALSIWMFLLGFIIAPIDYIVYATPFFIIEFISLLIVNAKLKHQMQNNRKTVSCKSNQQETRRPKEQPSTKMPRVSPVPPSQETVPIEDLLVPVLSDTGDIICPVCNMPQRSDRKVCWTCGKRFITTSATAITSTSKSSFGMWECKHCLTYNNNTNGQCKKCGKYRS